eukprot:75971_1
MKRKFDVFKQAESAHTSVYEQKPLKRMKMSNDLNENSIDANPLVIHNELKLHMILFLQRFYDPSANSNIRYQEIFTEFIAYQRTQPLLTFADIDAITFENCRAVVRDAVSVAFCHVLSSYEEPVNIARKKSNVSNTANTSNNRSDCDVNPSIHHPQRASNPNEKAVAIPRAPNPNEKAMAIPRAPKAKKPFIRRIRLFRSSKNKRPLHKKHKSDEIDRVQCPLQTLKQSPNNNKNTKQRSVIDAQTCSSKSKVMISSTVAITSP